MGLVKTRRLAAMHPPSRCALRRTSRWIKGGDEAAGGEESRVEGQ